MQMKWKGMTGKARESERERQNIDENFDRKKVRCREKALEVVAGKKKGSVKCY